MGLTGRMSVSGARAAAAVARHVDVPVWVAAGVGRLLPARMWEAIEPRLAASALDAWDLDEEVVDPSPVAQVRGPAGNEPFDASPRRPPRTVAPEPVQPGRGPGPDPP